MRWKQVVHREGNFVNFNHVGKLIIHTNVNQNKQNIGPAAVFKTGLRLLGAYYV